MSCVHQIDVSTQCCTGCGQRLETIRFGESKKPPLLATTNELQKKLRWGDLMPALVRLGFKSVVAAISFVSLSGCDLKLNQPQQPQQTNQKNDHTDLLDPLNPIGIVNPASPISPFNPANQ